MRHIMSPFLYVEQDEWDDCAPRFSFALPIRKARKRWDHHTPLRVQIRQRKEAAERRAARERKEARARIEKNRIEARWKALRGSDFDWSKVDQASRQK